MDEIILLSVIGLFIFAIMWALSYHLFGVRPFIFIFDEENEEKGSNPRHSAWKLEIK